jgi:hypothetical protein
MTALNIDALLIDREETYGNFARCAEISQHMQALLFAYKDKDHLDYDQIEALQMICHKIARIINGDENLIDSWLDIAGYAKLVAERLQKQAKKRGN